MPHATIINSLSMKGRYWADQHFIRISLIYHFDAASLTCWTCPRVCWPRDLGLLKSQTTQVNKFSGSRSPIGRRACPLWKVTSRRPKVCERDGESVWLKVTRGLTTKAKVPLMRSEETVGFRGGGGGNSITVSADVIGSHGIIIKLLIIENLNFAAQFRQANAL